MMTIQSEFKTRKAAKEYLFKRGWMRNGNSLGDWLFVNRDMADGNQWRIVVRLNNGMWQIQHIQPIAVAATGTGFVSAATRKMILTDLKKGVE